MHHVCSLEIKVVTSILLKFSSLFSLWPSLTSARNRIQMAPARLDCRLLHGVHPHFKLCRCTKRKFETRMDAAV